MDTSKTKKHADFQSNYRRSSNFNNPLKDEPLEPKGNGRIKMNKEDSLTDGEKEDIIDAMDSMQKKFENTPQRDGAGEEE